MGTYNKEKAKHKRLLKTAKGKAYRKRKREESQLKSREREALLDYYGGIE